jgi:hypothetical protein
MLTDQTALALFVVFPIATEMERSATDLSRNLTGNPCLQVIAPSSGT